MSHTPPDALSRSRLVLGDAALQRLSDSRIILFGTGGVGSWCAEALIRTGARRLTLVDFDHVAPSNINRQMPATAKTVGRLKVEAAAERLLDINPCADIVAIAQPFNAATADSFRLQDYDYVIDAIDSLPDKALLIRRATATRAVLFSSMGAARKVNPLSAAVAEFWKVKGCPLAAALRRRFKKEGQFPSRKFRCVYSDEQPRPNQTTAEETGRVNGSLVCVTAVFGFTLASLVVNDVIARIEEDLEAGKGKEG